MTLHVLAIFAGIACLIPAALVAIGLIGMLIYHFMAGGFPDWVEPAIIWGAVVSGLAAGVWLIHWGVAT